MAKLDVMYSSKADNWGTPIKFFNEANTVYNFTLDGAADSSNALCPRWLGPGSKIAEDALAYTPKGEIIWLNPPYSKCKEFIAWAANNKDNNIIVALIPARTDTKWFHEYIWHDGCYSKVKLGFIKGRLKFVDPTGKKSTSAPFPSIIVEFGV